MPFVAIWMDLEIIILNKLDRESKYISLICAIFKKSRDITSLKKRSV